MATCSTDKLLLSCNDNTKVVYVSLYVESINIDETIQNINNTVDIKEKQRKFYTERMKNIRRMTV